MRSIEIPQPGHRGWRYRLFEILPGALTYIVLSLPIILGYISPRLAAYFIIGYLMLWFVRAIGLNLRGIQGWKLIKQHRAAPWGEMLQDLEILSPRTPNTPDWHERNIIRVAKYIDEDKRIKPSDVFHAVIVAFYNETIDVVEPTVQSVIDSHYDNKKIILILAYEERGGADTEQVAKQIVKKYGDNFYLTEAVKHPANIEGEIIGKGGNITYAGRKLQCILETKHIDPMNVLVTTLDSDNRPDKQYFGALTYTYCSTEDPKHSSYQPISMFLNNIWDAPALMRVVATGNSIWNIVLSLRPHMLRNFSAHAQPMAALIDTDFWSVRTIVEDGHQYWRTFFRYDGNYEVYPLYVPIYQDAVLTDKYIKTLKMQFIQVRRWAWGASDIAYVAHMGFMKKNKIPRPQLWSKFLRLMEGHLSWSTAPLILLLAALVPFFLNPESYLANQLPQIASRLQTVAMVGILVTLYLSFAALPPKPLRYKRHRNIFMLAQWIFLPITSIVYSSFAAIYSQTRLMFGWYLGFVVTEKAVKTPRPELTTVEVESQNGLARIFGVIPFRKRRQ